MANDLPKHPDIFRKKNIKSITVRYHDFWGNGKYVAEGSIEFKDGSLSAEQKFESGSFEGVVKLIRAALLNLPQ